MTIGILENLFSFFELRSIRLTGWGILRKIQWSPHIKWFKTSDSISSFFYGNLNSSIYIIYISYINSYTIIYIHFFPKLWFIFPKYTFRCKATVLMLVKNVCWQKTCMLVQNFHRHAASYMQLLKRRDFGEIVCWWICIKLYFGIFTNIQKNFQQQTSPTYSFQH